MVVGPEFGPVAGFCVAVVQRRRDLAIRSLTALAVGFPLAIATTVAVGGLSDALGLTPEDFSQAGHSLSRTISSPDWYAAAVGFLAGVAGLLSLSTAKSGALVGVLISVTTIPAAANIAVGVVYGDGSAVRGSAQTLLLNLGAILTGGLVTLLVQRAAYAQRRRRHAA
jgi:uncharacterized hydrophobic protein (TIGR00271 family)